MKKTLTLSIAALSAASLFAQLPVSTVAGKKQAVIEELTANLCGFCPGGHTTSEGILSANPGKVFAIRNHPNGFNLTNPSQSTSKDLRTNEASQLYQVPGILAPGQTSIGLPCATVNRMAPIAPATPTYAGGRLMGNGPGWASMVSTVLGQNSYVNIAGQAYVHPTTRQMIVNIEAYFTSNATSNTNNVVVALTQNNIIGYQSSGGNTYTHKHILRDYINGGSNLGARGEAITGPTTAGTKWTKTYTLTIPAEYGFTPGKNPPAVLQDLEIIAYIATTSDGKDITAACKVPITITTATDIFGPTPISDELVSNYTVYPSPMSNNGDIVFTLNKESDVTLNVVNALGQVVKTEKLNQLGVGEHKFALDASTLTNGIYFVNLTIGEAVLTKKISVLK